MREFHCPGDNVIVVRAIDLAMSLELA